MKGGFSGLTLKKLAKHLRSDRCLDRRPKTSYKTYTMLGLTKGAHMPNPLVACQRSGRCCTMLVSTASLDITDEDVARWEDQERDDILQWVSVIEVGDQIVTADFPVDPDGDDVEQCPFLEMEGTHALCQIHDTKPTVCATFHCVTRRWPEGGAYQLAVQQGLITPGEKDE